MQKALKRISCIKTKTSKGYVVTSEYIDIEEEKKKISPMGIFPSTLFDGKVAKTPNLSQYDGDWS